MMSLIHYTDDQKTLELCMNAFIEAIHQFQFIPEKFRTTDFFKMVINKSHYLFKYVPEELKSKELSMLAVELCHNNIRYVPPKYYCDELYLLLISNKIDRLRNISKTGYKKDSEGNPPDIYLCTELCIIGSLHIMYKINKHRVYSPGYPVKEIYDIGENNYDEQSDNDEQKENYERGLGLLYHACCKHNGMALYYVNPSYLSQELCITACCNSGMALQYVPLPLRTRALCQIAIKNAPEAKRFIPEHKSKQKKKIIIIKRPIVINYALKNKYKKIINTVHTSVPYYSAHEYKKINMVFDKDINIIKVDGYNGEMIPLDYPQIQLFIKSTIPMAKLYIEINRILRVMESINTYPIIYITYISKGAISDTIATMHVFMIDNCCNIYNTTFSGTPLNTRYSIITVNGLYPDPSYELYRVPLCNNLIDSLQSFYNCITTTHCLPQTFPIIYDYDIYTGLNGPMRKAVIKLNSDLIRANNTKRKLDDYKIENRLLKLELLEAKQMLNANKRHF